MKTIKQFKANVRRVKRKKYVNLENKDRVLKATMTLIRITVYGTLILIAFPVVFALIIAATLTRDVTDAVDNVTNKTTDWQGRTHYRR